MTHSHGLLGPVWVSVHISELVLVAKGTKCSDWPGMGEVLRLGAGDEWGSPGHIP